MPRHELQKLLLLQKRTVESKMTYGLRLVPSTILQRHGVP